MSDGQSKRPWASPVRGDQGAGRPARPINIDELPHNADWTKQTLDLFVPDVHGSFKRVENVDERRLYLRLNGKTVDEFKALPAYYLALRKQPWLREL